MLFLNFSVMSFPFPKIVNMPRNTLRGTQLWVTHHVPPKRPYLFSLAFSKDPHFYQLSPNDPEVFNKLLVTERPWHIFVTQRPSFSHLIVKKVTIFGKKFDFSENFDAKVEKFLAILALKARIFWCISLKDPYFCAFCHWKTSFLDAICHRKTPTSEVLGGTRMSLSYVSAPPPRRNTPLNKHCLVLKNNLIAWIFLWGWYPTSNTSAPPPPRC